LHSPGNLETDIGLQLSEATAAGRMKTVGSSISATVMPLQTNTTRQKQPAIAISIHAAAMQLINA